MSRCGFSSRLRAKSRPADPGWTGAALAPWTPLARNWEVAVVEEEEVEEETEEVKEEASSTPPSLAMSISLPTMPSRPEGAPQLEET